MRGSMVAQVGILLIGALVTFATLTTTGWPQTPVDPRSLIGEWGGSWVEKREGKVNGQYYLWIERVEGNKVYGRGEASGLRGGEFRFAGTLSGDRLTFGRDPLVELLIEGNRMRGGSVAREISLTKRK